MELVMIVLLAVIAVTGFGVWLLVSKRHPGNIPSGTREAPIVSDYGYSCDTCDKPLTKETHHSIFVAFNDETERQEIRFGGTAIVADYCPTHCTGGCQRGCTANMGA